MVIEVTARLIVDGATSATYALPTASAGPVNSEGLFGHYHDRHVDSVDDSSLGDQQRQHVLREKCCRGNLSDVHGGFVGRSSAPVATASCPTHRALWWSSPPPSGRRKTKANPSG